MSDSFGSYEKATSPKVDAGIYDTVIDSADVVREADGSLRMTENGKNLVDVVFRLDRETTLKRRFSISFAKNPRTGQYADFAKFLTAVTGIPCGDASQKSVTSEDLRGKRARINVIHSDDGFARIDSVAPPPKASGRPKPQPVQAEDEYSFPEQSPEDEEIPF